jgi:hypothetical protein
MQSLLQQQASGLAQGYKNPGSEVTPQLKAAVKVHRKRGVHVTPTVFLNGVEAGDVSSGWSLERKYYYYYYYYYYCCCCCC